MMSKAKKPLQAIGRKMLEAYEDLERATCPNCGRHTLGAEHVSRSGIRIACYGWNESNEDSSCAFVTFVLVTSTEELPAPIRERTDA